MGVGRIRGRVELRIASLELSDMRPSILERRMSIAQCRDRNANVGMPIARIFPSVGRRGFWVAGSSSIIKGYVPCE